MSDDSLSGSNAKPLSDAGGSKCNDSRLRGLNDQLKLLSTLCNQKEKEAIELRAYQHEVEKKIKECEGNTKQDQLKRDIVLPAENNETMASANQPVADSTLKEFETTKKKSVLEMILEASEEAKGLENRQNMLQVMYDDKSQQVEVLTQQVRECVERENKIKQRLELVECENSQLRMSSLESDTSSRRSMLEHQQKSETTGTIKDDDYLNEMKLKIAELNNRLAALMKSETPAEWVEMCQSCLRELNDANCKLEHYQHYQQTFMQAERERADKATAERDAAVAEKTKLVLQVEKLEEKVSELEHQLETNSDTRLALELQIDEYMRDAATVQQERDRDKAQLLSMTIQLDTLYEELQKLKQETAERKEKLQEAKDDQELLRTQLRASSQLSSRTSSSHGSAPVSGVLSRSDRRHRHNPPQQTGSEQRGTLEEDSGRDMKLLSSTSSRRRHNQNILGKVSRLKITY